MGGDFFTAISKDILSIYCLLPEESWNMGPLLLTWRNFNPSMGK